MTLRIINHPSVEPVLLSEIRDQLGITSPDDTHRDLVMTIRITSARRWCEQHTGIAFITQTWTHYADCFGVYINLKANLQSVDSVKYIDGDGTLTTLDPSKYTVDLVNSRIHPSYGNVWPSPRLDPNSVQIQHVSGFGAASAVPEEIKDAIKFIVGHWENYQSTIEGAERIQTIPYAVTQLLQHHVDLRSCL